MAKSLKESGTRELEAIRTRTRRQLALKRIGQRDHDYIVGRLDEIETRITEMEEKGAEDE